jgi:hypothetical protein
MKLIEAMDFIGDNEDIPPRSHKIRDIVIENFVVRFSGEIGINANWWCFHNRLPLADDFVFVTRPCYAMNCVWIDHDCQVSLLNGI